MCVILPLSVYELRTVDRICVISSVPHYHVVSKQFTAAGRFSPVVDWVRAFMIEALYRRFGTLLLDMSPFESVTDLGDSDDVPGDC